KACPTKFLSRLPFAENQLRALSSFFSRRCFFIHACLGPYFSHFSVMDYFIEQIELDFLIK
ncbi:MAG: hypothetical protein ACPL5I_02015, partial [Thermodesulfobacteriota bacterium]